MQLLMQVILMLMQAVFEQLCYLSHITEQLLFKHRHPSLVCDH